MKITFLGTGTSQGVPVITCHCDVCKSENQKDKRLRTSAMIETGELTFVIDTGPDFRQQMLRENVQKIDAILITHQHKDHIAGLDDVRAFNYHQKQYMNVYGDHKVTEAIRNEFAYSFAQDKYPGVPDIKLHSIENKEFYILEQKIIPIRVMHLRLPIFGYRINNFAYITDANFVAEEEKDKIRNVDVLVVNALRKLRHISHFNLEEALQFISEINPRVAYLTHISHYLGFHDQVQSELPKNVFLAYDGLVVQTID